MNEMMAAARKQKQINETRQLGILKTPEQAAQHEQLLKSDLTGGGSPTSAMDMAPVAGAALNQLTKNANPEGTVGIGSNVAQMALLGSKFGAEGAAVGAGAGLVVGMLGAASAKKERERNAAANYYSQISQIENQKQERLSRAIQNMSSNMGQSLLQNRSVSL